MPNWCYTDIRIKANENETVYLYEELKNAISENRAENGFGKNWLGNVVEYIGRNYNDVRCRGSIHDLDSSDRQVTMMLETAWVPQLGPIILLIDYLGLSDKAELFYVAEEPGCDVFCTNDPDIIGKYLVDNGNCLGKTNMLKSWEYEFVSEEELRHVLCEETGLDYNTEIYKLIGALEDEYEDIFIHQYDYAHPNDFI